MALFLSAYMVQQLNQEKHINVTHYINNLKEISSIKTIILAKAQFLKVVFLKLDYRIITIFTW